MRALFTFIAISILNFAPLEATNPTYFFFQTHSNEEKVAKMTTLLNLSAEQQKKYKDLLNSSEKELSALKAKSKNATKEEKKKMQEAYKTNYENQLKKILTAEQFKKLQEEAKKHKK